MRPSWEDYFFDMARVAATRSTCNRRNVGAVIVRDRRIISTGYNGSVPGESHCVDVGCDVENGHCVRTVHAEVNAIAQAARYGVDVDGASLYSTCEPCRRCRQIILSAGIKQIEFLDPYVG